MAEMRRFHVVIFPFEGTSEIVPENWFNAEKCFWPPVAEPSKVKKLVQAFAEPGENWKEYDAFVMATTRTYEKAEKKLKKALYTSDQNSDCSALSEEEMKTRQPSCSTQKRLHPLERIHGEIVEMKTAMEAFQQRVFDALEEIKEGQKKLHSVITEQHSMITEQFAMETDGVKIPEDCPKLPCTLPEQLGCLNSYLDDKNNFSVMCKYFGSVGGSSASNVVRRILQTIMSNPLSLQYNWKGTGGIKLAFSKFHNICRMIIMSVREHSSFEKTTDLEIENYIKKWMAYAKDREGGRSHRK